MLYSPLYRFVFPSGAPVVVPPVAPAFAKFSVDGNIIYAMLTSTPTVARVQLEYRLANSDDIPWTMLDFTNHPYVGLTLSGTVARGHLYAFRTTSTNEEQSCPTDGTYYFIYILPLVLPVTPPPAPTRQPTGAGTGYMILNISDFEITINIDSDKYKLKPKEYININIVDLTKTNLFGLADSKTIIYKLLDVEKPTLVGLSDAKVEIYRDLQRLLSSPVPIRQLNIPDNSAAEDVSVLNVSPQVVSPRVTQLDPDNRVRITNLSNSSLMLSVDGKKTKLNAKQSTVLNIKDINKTNIVGLANSKLITYKDLSTS